jgi:hypothetical protein
LECYVRYLVVRTTLTHGGFDDLASYLVAGATARRIGLPQPSGQDCSEEHRSGNCSSISGAETPMCASHEANHHRRPLLEFVEPDASVPWGMAPVESNYACKLLGQELVPHPLGRIFCQHRWNALNRIIVEA